ncbi:MAG: hypothetical protein AAF211_00385, partial [Myxococcota bacterium]
MRWSFEVALTPDEARRALGLGSWGRRPHGFSVLGMLVAGVLLVAAEPWHPASSPATNGLLLLFVGAVMAIGLVPLLPGPWRATFVRRRAPEAQVPHVVHVTPGYLAVEEGDVERRFGWPKVQRVRFAFDLVVIDVPDRRVVLPDRVFADDVQRTAVL